MGKFTKQKPKATKQNSTAIKPTKPIPIPTYGSDVKDSSGKVVGQARFDPNTGKPLAAPKAAPLKPENVSNTTISNLNKKDQIPGMVNKLNDVSQKGVTTDMEGNPRYADQSFVEDDDEQDLVEADTSEEDKQSALIMKTMKRSLDSGTKSQIDMIQRQFAQRKAEQAEINARNEKGVTNALLMGGVTGQGSSAQFAPISSQGIVQAQESYGLKQIADLDFQEQGLIMEAKEAQRTGEYKLMEAKLIQIEEKRKEKIDTAIELNKTISEQNEKMREQNLAFAREDAISQVVASGVTDVQGVMQALKQSGIKATAKEVGDTVALLQGIGGSGIVGEYNFYAAQARAAGQVPLDFTAYQNEDANRKKSIAKAGVAGTVGTSGQSYTSQQEKIISSVDGKVANSPVYKKITNMRAYADNVDASLSQGTGVGDLAAINQFQKVIDEGAVTRDQDVKLIQGSQSLLNSLQTKAKRLQKGEQLSPELRQQMKKAVADILAAQEKSIQNDPFVKAKKKELERNNINPEDSIFGELEGYQDGGSVSDPIQVENEAKLKVMSVSQSNPKAEKVIRSALGKNTPYATIISIFPEFF